MPAAGAMMVSAPAAGILVKKVGPKALAIVASLFVLFGMLWLTQINVDSSYLTVVV